MSVRLLPADPADPAPFEINATGLVVHGTPSFEDWLAFGDVLHVAEQGLAFAVGDYLNYGEARYGELYAQTAVITGYAAKTLQNWSYVARAVDPSRRRESVSFSVHAEVASLKPSDQTAVLQSAEENLLTVDMVRAEVHRLNLTDLPTTLWLVVSCANPADQAALADRMTLEGRTVKWSAGKAKAS